MAEVELTKNGAVATIRLNRPERKNATTPELWRLLGDYTAEVREDSNVRAVILTGAGTAFCAGADTGASFPKTPAEARTRMSRAHSVVTNLYNMEKPVIAAVRGPAVGSGFSLALACDFLLASETARFSYAFSRIGLVGDCGALFLLVQRLGLQMAKHLAYTSRIIDSAEAREIGVTFRTLPDNELDGAANDMATELAAGPTMAIGVSKRLMQKNWATLEDFLPNESLAIPLMNTTHDAAEGIQAIREKRLPRFTGA